MEIRRDFYLDKLIKRKNNGLIKVVTGIRRCGKSYLSSSFGERCGQESYYPFCL